MKNIFAITLLAVVFIGSSFSEEDCCYVDTFSGSDTNPGTPTRPLATQAQLVAISHTGIFRTADSRWISGIPAENLVGAWKLVQGSDSSKVYDSANGLTGSITAATFTSDGMAFSDNQYIDFGNDPPAFRLIGDLSIVAAFKSTVGEGWILHASDYSLRLTGGRLQFISGTTFSVCTGPVNDGQWHVVVASLSRTTVTCYIDGAIYDSFASQAPTLISAHAYLSLTSTNAFKGSLAFVALYSRALTSLEAFNYQATLAAMWPGNFTAPVWVRQGIVVADAGEPSVLYESGCLLVPSPCVKMWSGTDTVPKVYYQESQDGVHFVKYGSPLVSGVARNSILHDGSVYKLYVSPFPSQTQIDLYTSADGMTNFTLDTPGVITTSSGQWDASNVCNSWVIQDGSTYRMIYDGQGPTGGFYFGTATSTDSRNWTKGARLSTVVGGGGPALFKIGSAYQVWVQSCKGGFLPCDINRFYSTDWTTWTEVAPLTSVFARASPDEGPPPSTVGQASDVSLVEIKGRTFMYYSALVNGNTGPSNIKLAIANMKMADLITTREGMVSRIP